MNNKNTYIHGGGTAYLPSPFELKLQLHGQVSNPYSFSIKQNYKSSAEIRNIDDNYDIIILVGNYEDMYGYYPKYDFGQLLKNTSGININNLFCNISSNGVTGFSSDRNYDSASLQCDIGIFPLKDDPYDADYYTSDSRLKNYMASCYGNKFRCNILVQ